MAIFRTGNAELGNERIVLERSYQSNLQVVLEQRQIFPKDPGLGTPAMVYLRTKDGIASCTYWCYLGEGCVDCYELTDAQIAWLDKQEDYINNKTDSWYKLAEEKLAKH